MVVVLKKKLDMDFTLSLKTSVLPVFRWVRLNMGNSCVSSKLEDESFKGCLGYKNIVIKLIFSQRDLLLKVES